MQAACLKAVPRTIFASRKSSGVQTFVGKQWQPRTLAATLRFCSSTVSSRRYAPTSVAASTLFKQVHGDWSQIDAGQKVWGWYTVHEGGRVAVWSSSGNVKYVDGPSSIAVLGSVVQKLVKYVAGPNEFVSILHKDGKKSVLRGPTYVWQDPVEHQAVSVQSALNVSTNEALVLYDECDGTVTRRVVKGPSLFVPKGGNEWIHQFVWHGVDADAYARGINRKAQGALRFTKLRLIPDQLYFDVEKVRTRDDALLTVKTMIFFQLCDIEQMVDSTHDVISELINSLSADIIERTSAMSFDLFREQTGEFNKLASYPSLVAKAEAIGYKISKVVFRGYEASDTLQTMHDRAIESRTELRLQAEKEEQEQDLLDFRLTKGLDRQMQERKEEERVQQHGTSLSSMRLVAELEEKRERESQQLASEAKKLEQQLVLKEKEFLQQDERQRRKLESVEAHYCALQKLGVDLTKYLSAQPHRIVRFEHENSAESSDVAVQYHMHDESAKQ